MKTQTHIPTLHQATDTKVTNLRPHPVTGALCAVGNPTIIAEGSFTPLFTSSGDVVAVSGTTITVFPRGSAPYQAGKLPSPAVSACCTGQNAVIMTEKGPVSMTFDEPSGHWQLHNATPIYPQVTLDVIPVGTLTANVGRRTLSRDYSRSQRLDPIDTRLVTADILDAYTRLYDLARSTGCWMQPVIARWRIVYRTRTLYTSAPVLLSPSGLQTLATVGVDASVTSKGLTELHEYSIQAEVFRLKATVAGGADGSLPDGMAIEVDVSPQLQPVDYSADAEYSINPRNTTGPFMSLRPPGASMSSATAVHMIAGITDNWNASAVASRIASDGSTEIYCTSARNAKECRSHIAGLSRNLAARDPLLASVSPPHSFSAAGCAVSGSVVAWHSLSPLPFGGYPLGQFVCSTVPGHCRAVVTVSFSDGSSVSSGWRSPDTRPAEILPLLYYPDPDACRITIRADTDAGEYVFEAPLTPGHDGAFYVRPGLRPFDPFTVPGAFSAATPLKTPFLLPCAVAVASVSDPLTPTSAAIVSPSAIQALVPAPRSSSPWEFTSPKFLAFTSSGTYAVAANASSPSRPAVKGSRLLDPRAVATPASVCTAPDAVYAVAAGDFIRFSAGKATTVASHAVPPTSTVTLGAASDEIWIVVHDPLQTLIYSATHRGFYLRKGIFDTAPPGSAMLPSPSGSLLVSDSRRLLDLAMETPASDIHIGYEAAIRLPRRRLPGIIHGIPRLMAATLSASTPSITGSVHIGPHTVTLSGALHAPLTCRFIYAPISPVIITISATASSSTRIDYISLTTDNH